MERVEREKHNEGELASYNAVLGGAHNRNGAYIAFNFSQNLIFGHIY